MLFTNSAKKSKTNNPTFCPLNKSNPFNLSLVKFVSKKRWLLPNAHCKLWVVHQVYWTAHIWNHFFRLTNIIFPEKWGTPVLSEQGKRPTYRPRKVLNRQPCGQKSNQTRCLPQFVSNLMYYTVHNSICILKKWEISSTFPINGVMIQCMLEWQKEQTVPCHVFTLQNFKMII